MCWIFHIEDSVSLAKSEMGDYRPKIIQTHLAFI